MNKLFKWFTTERNLDHHLALVYVTWFTSEFDEGCFSGLDKLIYLYLEHSAKMGIPVSKRYLESFIKTDCKYILSEYNIKNDVTAQYDYKDPSGLEQATFVMGNAMMNWYDISISDTLEDQNFKVDAYEFIKRHKKEELRNVIINNFPRIDGGDDVETIANDLSAKLSYIDSMFDDTKIDNLDFQLGKEKSGKVGILPFLSETGIPCWDGDCGGILGALQTHLVGVSGAGKTRLYAKHMVYIPAVTRKQDVLFDTLELKEQRTRNLLISIHIATKFNIKIPDSLMNLGRLTTEQRQYYETAEEDLFNNPKYGKIYLYDSYNLTVERYYQERLQFFRLHPECKINVLDYMGFVDSEPILRGQKVLLQHEIIRKLCREQAKLISRTGVHFANLCQYTKEGAEKAERGMPIDQGDVQGGQAVHNFTDYLNYMTQTPEQKMVSMFNIATAKARGSSGFPATQFKSDLAISKFDQIKSQARQS